MAHERGAPELSPQFSIYMARRLWGTVSPLYAPFAGMECGCCDARLLASGVSFPGGMEPGIGFPARKPPALGVRCSLDTRSASGPSAAPAAARCRNDERLGGKLPGPAFSERRSLDAYRELARLLQCPVLRCLSTDQSRFECSALLGA